MKARAPGDQDKKPPTLESVTSIREDGSRRDLHPADFSGRFLRARTWAALGLIIVYGLLPWVKLGDYPLVFLDVSTRRFHLFGLTLAAQDMWLLFFIITGLGFTLFFITALLGRVWCGWACPQTVFLEHVYRRIERWIEGDALARRKLDAAPWAGPKLAKRGLKLLLFVLISALIAHLFLAYFISLPVLWQVLHEAPGENWGLFVFMMVFTGLLTFNFAWFREQLCIVICPYGRLQSVLIDDNSMVVGYDAKRGEPRGHKGTAGAGDCIACNRCVQVCPTGIDIRQGLQLECIACTACIDACDDVMDKLDRKRGLIRYASLTQLAGGSTKWIRPRTIVYTVMLTVGTLFAAFTFSKVRPANFAVTRIVGTPYIVDDEHVRNQFLLRVVNKTNAPATFTVSVTGATGLQQSGFNEAMTLPAMAEEVHPLILSQSRSTYAGRFKFQFVLRDKAGTFELKRDAEFLGPDADLLKEQGNEREREHGEREKEHERR